MIFYDVPSGLKRGCLVNDTSNDKIIINPKNKKKYISSLNNKNMQKKK